MLPKGKRRQSVRAQYVAARSALQYPPALVEPPAPAPIPVTDSAPDAAGLRTFTADASAANLRLDRYLALALPDISRARVQLLIANAQVTVNGAAASANLRLRGGELIQITGEPRPAPLRATPEAIPLDIVFEDADLAVVNKPSGMMVHAGAGSEERNRGTLVNALLHHFQTLSAVGGDLRPGIVHRLDKDTSGLILVAKNDSAHRHLAEMFSERRCQKTYLALVHGHIARDRGTVNAPISRDAVRRTRMTTRRADGRAAVSHYTVLERLTTPRGKFSLVEVRIETGRTHQIRVHLSSLGHPVVGDTLYGAPAVITAPVPSKSAPRSRKPAPDSPAPLTLPRNFLHAARLVFPHPRTGLELTFQAPLPAELTHFLEQLR
jgi:23S rRNA pseudouridine1911/1915/1917 synthase